MAVRVSFYIRWSWGRGAAGLLLAALLVDFVLTAGKARGVNIRNTSPGNYRNIGRSLLGLLPSHSQCRTVQKL
ncbi:hypothetical protein WAI453_000835 [Rhynchosporium graminicola]